MLLEHERGYGLGMDALVIVCSAGGSTWQQRVSTAQRPRLRPTKNVFLDITESQVWIVFFLGGWRAGGVGGWGGDNYAHKD